MPTVEPFQRKYIIDHSQARRALEEIRQREAALVRGSEQGYSQQRAALGRYVRAGEQGHARVGRAGTNAARAIGGAFKQWVAGVAVAAFTAVILTFRKALQVAGEFKNGLAEIGTLSNADAAAMRQLEQGIIDIAGRVGGGTFQEFTKALYDIESAGFSGAEGLGVLETAARTAVAGVTDVSTAADLLTSVLNAYSLSGDHAAEVSDKLFATVRAGKTTIPELASSIGKLAPIASAAGVPIEEMLAAVAQLTKSGLSTAEAVTQVKGVISTFIRPADNAAKVAKQLGVGLDTATLESLGLVGAIHAVNDAAGGSTEALGQLFTDTEALQGVLGLAKNDGADFAETLDGIEGSAGDATEAFNRMKGESEQLATRVKNRLNEGLLALGSTILPLVNTGMEALLRQLENLHTPTQRVIDALKEIPGVDKALILKLETQEALRQAREAAADLNKAIASTEVRVNVNVRPSLEPQGRSDFALKPTLATQYQTKPLSELGTDELETRIASVQAEYQSLAEQIAKLNEEGTKVPAIFSAQADGLREVERSLTEALATRRGYEAELENSSKLVEELARQAQAAAEAATTASSTPPPPVVTPPTPEELEAIAKAQKVLEAVTEASQLAAATTKDQRAALQEVFDVKEQIAKLDEAAANLPKEAYEEQRAILDERLKKAQEQLEKETAIAEAIKRATTEVNTLAAKPLEGFGLLGIDNEDAIARVTSALQDYERTITSLQNQKSLGEISEKELIEQSAEATQAFMQRIRGLYEAMEKLGLITEPVRKAFRAAFEAGEKGADQSDKTLKKYNHTLGDTASALRSLEGLLNVFGDLDDTISSLIRGTADVLSNIQNIADARRQLDAGNLTQAGLDSATLLGGIGIAAGLATVITPLIQSMREAKEQSEAEIAALERQRETTEELIVSLEAHRRAFEDSIRGVFGESIVGGNTTIGGIKEAEAIAERLRQGISQNPLNEAEIQDLLAQIENLTGLEGLVDRFNDLIESGVSRGLALQQIVFGDGDAANLLSLIKEIEGGFGTFGDSMQGLVRMIEFLGDQLGVSAEDLRDLLVSEFERTGLSDALQEQILSQLEGLDLSDPEAVKAFLDSLKQGFADGSLAGLLGDVTPEEFLDFIAFLEELLTPGADGTTSTGDGGTVASQSVQFVRQATEVQVNVMIDLLREIAYWLQTMATGGAVPQLPAGLGYHDPRDYVPAIPTPDVSARALSVYNTIPIGPITLDQNLTEGQITAILEAVELRLRTLNQTAIRKHRPRI